MNKIFKTTVKERKNNHGQVGLAFIFSKKGEIFKVVLNLMVNKRNCCVERFVKFGCFTVLNYCEISFR